VGIEPPTIVLFTNGPSLFDNTYQRYLVKVFRDNLGFGDIPLKLFLRHKRREDISMPDGVEPLEAISAEDEAPLPEEIDEPRPTPKRPEPRHRRPGVWKDV
jgi:GTP-binding protein